MLSKVVILYSVIKVSIQYSFSLRKPEKAQMSMRNIYKKIAKESGLSVKVVKEEMQNALEYAYQSNSTMQDGIISARQNAVPRKNKIPTPEEFVRYTVNLVKDSK